MDVHPGENGKRKLAALGVVSGDFVMIPSL